MKPKVEKGVLTEPIKEKTQGDSDQEMMNLENEIYSLTHYADDEEELVAQMFASIKGSKLEAMMPPILKEIPLIDVQQLCLHELRGMSQRRILSIINGQEMSGSSSEDSDEDKKQSRIQDDNEDSNLGGSLIEGEKDLPNLNDPNLTALDILELEMRAKLIKTMLEKQDGDDDDDDDKELDIGNGYVPDIKIKEEPLTPENTRDKIVPKNSEERRHKSKYSRRRSRKRSDSRSYSSSSFSYRSSSRSGSESNGSERKKDGSESPESRRPTKKKITKKEFEARMKKAKMNRSYRKRKDSEDDSGDNTRKKRGRSKKKVKEPAADATYSLKKTLIESNLVAKEEKDPPQELEEGEEGEQVEEGEIVEKEEGEIDSNEEGACSSNGRKGSLSTGSKSHSRTYSSASYSSSSRGRSYSRSPRRRKHKKRSGKHRRSRSKSLSDVPKVPNWQVGKELEAADYNKGGARLDVDMVNSEEDFDSKDEVKRTLPSKEDRQSVSFSFNKKTAPIKTSSELNEDANPNAKPSDNVVTTEVEEIMPLEDNEDISKSSSGEGLASTTTQVESAALGRTALKNKVKATSQIPKGEQKSMKEQATNKTIQDEDVEPGEVVEDFYKGADQLSFSEEEGECEDEADLQKFLHDDTPVEPINVGDSILRKSVKVVSNKDEPPIVSWESKKKKERMKGDLVLEGVGFIKTVLSESQNVADSSVEDSNEVSKGEDAEELSQPGFKQDTPEESSQDVLERLPETEAEDSRESHSLDIIGVIDPKESEYKEEPFDEELAAGGSSWSMRWLQSEKVQKVVSNSTLLSKVRKKIQAKGKANVKEPNVLIKPPHLQPLIEPKLDAPLKVESKPQTRQASNVIGSIEEYEKLFGIKVKAPTSLPQPKSQSKPPSTSHVSSLLDSDDDEDSEEEAIWSKIMKK